MGAMANMSKAIRTELEKYGNTLKDIPDDALIDFAKIVSAFGLDLYDEVECRGLITRKTLND